MYGGEYYDSRIVDVQKASIAATGSSRQEVISFATQAGLQGSYLEGAVFDQLFSRPQGTGLSAVQVLIEASKQGIPIYTITKNNLDTVLPTLAINESVKADIQNAILLNWVVIVPGQEISHGNWMGTGYIIRDLETGAAAYLLEGGTNGGRQANCKQSKKPLAQQIISFVDLTSAMYQVNLTLQSGGVLEGAPSEVVLSMVGAEIMKVGTSSTFAGSDWCTCRGNSSYENFPLCDDETPPFYGCRILKTKTGNSDVLASIKKRTGYTSLKAHDVREATDTPTECWRNGYNSGIHSNIYSQGQQVGISAVGCKCCNDKSGAPKQEERWGLVLFRELTPCP